MTVRRHRSRLAQPFVEGAGPSRPAGDKLERGAARPAAVDHRPQAQLSADREDDLLAGAGSVRKGEQAAFAIAQQQVELGLTGSAQPQVESAVECYN